MSINLKILVQDTLTRPSETLDVILLNQLSHYPPCTQPAITAHKQPAPASRKTVKGGGATPYYDRAIYMPLTVLLRW